MNALLFERPIWFTTSPLEFEEEAQVMEDITYHRPVLVTEAVELLAPPVQTQMQSQSRSE